MEHAHNTCPLVDVAAKVPSGNLQISVALLALFRAFLLLEKRKVQKGEKLLALFALFVYSSKPNQCDKLVTHCFCDC